MNTCNFTFGTETTSTAAHIATLRTGIANKSELLRSVAFSLGFPSYFGGNWDALDECIRDLSWLPEGDVVLKHPDLPLAHDLSSLSTYSFILKGAVEKFSGNERLGYWSCFPRKRRA